MPVSRNRKSKQDKEMLEERVNSRKKKKTVRRNTGTIRLRNTLNSEYKSRRITRFLAKKMNINNYKSLSSRHALKKNKNPRKLVYKMKGESDQNLAENEKNVVVLYDGKKPKQVKQTNKSRSILTVNQQESLIDQVPSSQSEDLSTLTVLTDEDNKMINEVLDLMEDYGFIEYGEKQDAFKDIQTDLVSTCEELESTINFMTEEIVNATIHNN